MKTLACVISALALAVPVAAQTTGQPATVASNPVVSLNASETQISDLAKTLTTRTGVPVLVGTGASGVFSGNLNNMPLETILDMVAKSNELQWHKAFIAKETPADKMLAATEAEVALLTKVKTSGTFVVYDPVSKSEIKLERKASDIATVSKSTESLGLRPVYLISKPVAATAAAPAKTGDLGVDEYAESVQKQNESFLNMTPEQRNAALMQQVNGELAMDPQMRQDYFKAMADAYKNMRDTNPGLFDQWRNMGRERWGAMRDLFGDMRDGRGNGGGRGGQNPD